MFDHHPPLNMMQYYYHYDVKIFDRSITTILTKSPEYVDWWIQAVVHNRHGQPLIVGLGVELYAGHVSTIQLCIAHHCLIYHLYYPRSFSRNLVLFFQDHNNTFVGFGLQPKLNILIHEATCRPQFLRYLDLSVLAEDIYIRQGPPSADLTDLALHTLENVDVVWPHPGGRWDLPCLSYQQAQYACVHANVSLQMGMLLMFRRIPERFCIRVVTGEYGAMEHVHEVYFFNRTIVTTVTNRAIAVEKWIADVTQDGVVGFGVELTSFNSQEKPATVQLCVGRRCLVIQFFRMKDRHLPNLERFLLRDNNTFVGYNIEHNMGVLFHWMLVAEGGRVKCVDLGIFTANIHLADLSYVEQETFSSIRRVVHDFLEGRGHVPDDWHRPLLSDEQVQKLCIRAASDYELANRLLP